jgi:lipopolysaccharide assembly outer membrane protein LptD (OstA)
MRPSVKKGLTALILALALSAPPSSPLLHSQEQSAEPEKRQEQEKPQPKRSIMDMLRERITGGLGAAIEILSSGSMETSGDWVTISDNAQITYKDTTIMADRISFNQSTYELNAEGNVVLLNPGIRVGGDKMAFNLREVTGEVENPLVETNEGFILGGSHLVKYGPDRYKIEHARLTSCTQPTPYWLLRASLIDFQVDKAASLRNVRFNLGVLPIIYTPWLRLPMNNERSSGLLMPMWGTSDFHGTFFNTGYFWAINRSQDTTVTLDYYSLRGVRYGGEYRNYLGNNNFTNTHFFYINDDTVGYPRYEGLINSRQALPWGMVASGNMEFLSDREYRRDFINRNIYYSPLFRRSASLVKNFSVYTLGTTYYDVSRFVGPNRISAIRYEPTIDFRGRERQIFNLPVYYSFQANYAHPSIVDIRRPNPNESFKEKGRDAYHRLDLLGTLKAPIKTFAPWLTFTPTFSARDTEYSKRYSEKKDRIVNKKYSRRYYDLGFDMTGPVFSRIYGRPEQNATRYKHIVEPRLTYRWRSDIEKESRIIVIDQIDNFYKVHELQWSLDNRVMRKRVTPRNPAGEIVEMLKVSLSQYVTLDDKLQTSYNKAYLFDPDALEVTGRFSPLRIDTRFRISNNLSASALMEYSFSASSFISYTIGANLRLGTLRYNFGWYKTQKQYIDFAYYRPASNRLVTNGDIDLFGGFLTVRGAFDYDFQRKRVLNYLVGGGINAQCIGIQGEIRKLNILGQEDIQIRFGITLGGLKALLSPEDNGR